MSQVARPREIEIDTAVERAMQTFWDRGYENTSTRDLVECTGMGQGSLYHAFGSKHGVFEAALDHYLACQTEAVVALLRHAEQIRPAIREVLESLVEADLTDDSRRGCLMVNSAAELGGRDEVVCAKVSAAYRRVERALADAINRGRGSGELGAGPDADVLARFLLTVINGLRVVGKATGDRRRLQDTVDVAISALG